jgi:hypothetical protein
MHPIRTNKLPNTYRGPVPEVADLPCYIDPVQDRVVSVFTFTAEEREAIANGANLQLSVMARPLPPVALSVTDYDHVEAWQDTDLRCIDCSAVYIKQRDMTHCGHCGGKLYPAAYGSTNEN